MVILPVSVVMIVDGRGDRGGGGGGGSLVLVSGRLLLLLLSPCSTTASDSVGGTLGSVVGFCGSSLSFSVLLELDARDGCSDGADDSIIRGGC